MKRNRDFSKGLTQNTTVPMIGKGKMLYIAK
jgi:hypothetical protein